MIQKINKIISPLLIVITYMFLVIESFSYIGFLRKYLLFDSRFFLVISLLSYSLFLKYRLNSKDVYTKFLQMMSLSNKIFVVLLVLVYIILQFIEAKNYNNYIFSNYHIQPDVFFNVVLFSILLVVIEHINLKKISFTQYILGFFVLILLVNNINKTFNLVIKSNLYILNNLSFDYDKKMNKTYGFYYDYMKFVREHTPEDARILTPPQEEPWDAEGNVALSRYFVYPRKLYNGSYNGVDLNDVDYVMIAWGSWNIEDQSRYGWPKSKVKAEKIIYINPDNKVVNEYYEDFDPSDLKNKGGWGLIKIKK